jgi:hypothetical protein
MVTIGSVCSQARYTGTTARACSPMFIECVDYKETTGILEDYRHDTLLAHCLSDTFAIASLFSSQTSELQLSFLTGHGLLGPRMHATSVRAYSAAALPSIILECTLRSGTGRAPRPRGGTYR